jgi:hypothetical protein
MLSSIYQQWRGRGRTEITPIADAFFPPLLVRKPDEWTNATHRVAYIGQETLGWSWTQRDVAEYGYTWGYEDIETLHKFLEYDRSVEALIDGYGQFNFAARQPLSYRSPPLNGCLLPGDARAPLTQKPARAAPPRGRRGQRR